MTALPPISAAGGWKHRDEQDVFAGPPEDPLPPDLYAVYIIYAEGSLLYNEKSLCPRNSYTGTVTKNRPCVTLDVKQ